MKQLMKRWLALGMSFAMAFTMIPAGSGDVVKAEETTENAASGDPATSSGDPAASTEDPYKDSLLAAYDFDVDSAAANTTIPDVSGNGKDATLKGTGATVADGMLTLPGGKSDSTTAAYVEIPGNVFVDQDTLTITLWLKDDTNSGANSITGADRNYAAMYFGKGTGAYWLLNPGRSNKVKSAWTNTIGAADSNNYPSEIGVTNNNGPAAIFNEWAMYTTVVTADTFSFYLNGEKIGEDVEKSTTTTDFGKQLTAYIGKSAYPDAFYKGGVYGVRVYNKAFSQQDVWNQYYRDMPGDKNPAEIAKAAIEEVKTNLKLDCSEVTEDLKLPSIGAKGATITWKSSNTNAITDDGKVTRAEQDVNLTLTATIKVGSQTGTKEFAAKVLNLGPEGKFKEMLKNLKVDQTVVIEDFELQNTVGEHTTVTWSSNNNSAIKIETAADGKITGKVTRPETGSVEVVLTAEVTYNDGTNTFKETVSGFSVKVLANVLSKAIETYDFADFSVSSADSNILTDNSRQVKLEGSGKKPVLKEDEIRGKVLSLAQQEYSNRADALLPSNPFAGKSVDNGFTLSFWTKTTGNPGGARCLVDFEVAPAATGKRAGTLAVNQQMVYWNTTDQNGNFTDFNIGNMNLTVENGWTMVTMAVTKTGIAFYRNGVKIGHTVQSGEEKYEQLIKDLAGSSGIAEPNKTNVRLGASLATYWSCAGALMDDVSFFGSALSAEEVSTLYQETKVNVPLEKVEVSGESTLVAGDKVQLSAVLVPSYTTIEDRTVTWSVADEEIASINSSGRLEALATGETTVTATVAGIASAPFTVKVVAETESLPAGKKYLAVYSTTKAFYESAANIEQETRSVYMAVSEDGKNFEVLNNGGGVIFSKNSAGTLQITRPRIYKANGKFTVVAPDNTASKGLHVFTSADGVHYYDDTVVASSELSSAPLKKANFKLMLKGTNILETDNSITLGNAIELTDEEYTYIVNKLGTVINTGLEELKALNITAAESGKVTEAALHEAYQSVNALYNDGSKQNFKIDWSGALKDADLTKDGTYTITGKVVQTKYENNLKELNGSNLPDDDPTNVPAEGEDFPDNYDPKTGKVYYDSTKFIEGMADPHIYWDEKTQYYYMTASYFPEDGDAIDGNDTTQTYDRVVLRRGKTLEELQTRAKQITIWKAGNQGYDDNGKDVEKGYRFIWAPEIHRVGDYWVIYFTESQDPKNNYGIYSHALVLDGEINPYDTALTASNGVSQWKDYKMCVSDSVKEDPDSDIPRDPFSLSFCLDMTYFKDKVNGTSYVLWAGKPTASYGGSSTDLFIATVDEGQPWKITSTATRLTCSEYGWERIRFCVNEGPTILQNNGNVFLGYSVSGTGSEYAIGMLNAKGGENLLDINQWTKNPYPVLTSRDVNGEEGPGHNSFTVDKDGNNIFVYHARPTSHNYQKCGKYNKEPLQDPCRHARLKRVHWAEDGTPILKMTYEDELVDTYKTVTLTINVGEGGSDLPIPVERVTFGKTELSLKVGEKELLEAAVEPDNATNTDLTWDSSDPSVATVVNGEVTAIKTGTTTITATAVSGVSASCNVTVTKSGGSDDVAVTGITLNKERLTLVEGKKETLTATVKPDNATNKKVTWTSSDEAVATVDENGEVTAVKKGTATITAKAGDKTATCEVTVTEDNSGGSSGNVPVTGITLNKTVLSLKVNASETLTATVTPANATDKNITWDSSDKTVAIVDNGKVTALKAGTTVITAKAGGKEAKCTVTVTAGDGGNDGNGGNNGGSSEIALTGIKLSKKTLKIGVKETFTLKATLQPANTTVKTKTPSWKSSNKKIVTVNSKGKITAKRKGTATITATIGKIKATCKVTVCAAPTKIKLKKTKISLKKGKTAQISVKSFTPKKAYCSSFTYKVKSKKIATVSSTGKITAKKKGTTTITVTCKNNKKAKATVKVTVK